MRKTLTAIAIVLAAGSLAACDLFKPKPEEPTTPVAATPDTPPAQPTTTVEAPKPAEPTTADPARTGAAETPAAPAAK